MWQWCRKGVVGMLVALSVSCGGGADVEVAIGHRAPDFSLKALDGKNVKSQAYDGDVVVLNFWATWCQNCQRELPDLKDLANETKAKVIGIALDEGGAPIVEPFVRRHDIPYTILLGNERTFSRFRGIAIPYTLLLDRNQRIVAIYRGAIPDGALEEAVKKLG